MKKVNGTNEVFKFKQFLISFLITFVSGFIAYSAWVTGLFGIFN